MRGVDGDMRVQVVMRSLVLLHPRQRLRVDACEHAIERVMRVSELR
jgi:hypothetical protein